MDETLGGVYAVAGDGSCSEENLEWVGNNVERVTLSPVQVKYRLEASIFEPLTLKRLERIIGKLLENQEIQNTYVRDL